MSATNELDVDFFFSFRSPWSYLAVPRMCALARDYKVAVHTRIVQPIAIRDPSFFERAPKLWGSYFMLDMRRVAEFRGMKLGWPRPDPIAAGEAPDSPLHPVLGVNPLGIAAAEQGRGLAFIDEVSKIIWNGETNGWNEGEHLSRAAERAGLDLAALRVWVEEDPGRWRAMLGANSDALEKAGHWGVPTLVFEGEPFFGQDRIDVLIWRLEKAGLERR